MALTNLAINHIYNFTFPPSTLVPAPSDDSVTASVVFNSILSPGLNAGNPLYGQPAHLNASPR